jgi:hypothetical protein
MMRVIRMVATPLKLRKYQIVMTSTAALREKPMLVSNRYVP